MSTEVTKLVDDTDDSKEVGFVGDNPFLNRNREMGVTSGVFARFNGNTGNYIFGDDGEIPINESVVCDIYNAKIGWLGFDADNKPHKGPETLYRSGEPLGEPDTLAGIRWNRNITFEIILMDGSTGLYSAKADKQSRPIFKLIDAFGQKYKRHMEAPGVYKLPVVEFGHASFQVEVDEIQKDGTTRKIKATKFKEAFKIVNWYSNAEANDLRARGGDDSDVAEEAYEDGVTVIEVVEGAKFPPKEEPKARPSAAGPVRRNR